MKYSASIIIPAYNEEKNIARTISELKRELGSSYQIIVIDDGSSDRTFEISRKSGVECIRLPRNSGKAMACLSGAEKAKSNNMVFFDADAQFTAGDVKALLKKLKTNDIVTGSRDFSLLPFQRKLSNRLARAVINSITGKNYRDVLCGLRAVKREAFRKLNIKTQRYEFEAEMLIKASKAGLRVTEVPVRVDYSDYRGMPKTQSLKVMLYLLKQWLKHKAGL